MPKEGVSKGPGRRVSPRLKAAGESVGIDFTGATDRYPNSLLAHVALDFALRLEDEGKVPRLTQNALQEHLFKGYFTDGLYPDVENIVALGARVGIDEAAMRTELEDCHSNGTAERIKHEAMSASRTGVSGVPFFVINNVPAFSGAQDAAVIRDAFDELSN